MIKKKGAVKQQLLFYVNFCYKSSDSAMYYTRNQTEIQSWRKGGTKMANMRRTATWRNVGADVSTCRNMEEVLKVSGLDYTVVKRQAYDRFGGRFRKLKGQYYTERKAGSPEEGRWYGPVGENYVVIQNFNAFSFADDIEGITYVKAGETAGGLVYVIGSLPPVTILGDMFTPYIVLINGFGRNSSVKYVLSPLRVVCENQVPFIMKDAENAVMLRHTQSAPERIKEAAVAQVRMASGMAQLNQLAEKYAAMKINPRQFLMLLDAMFPMPVGMTEAAVSRIEEKRQVFIDAYDEEDNHAFRGTAWGLINAYTDCLTRKPLKGQATEESRFVSVTLKKDRNVFNTTPSGFLTMVNDIAVA